MQFYLKALDRDHRQPHETSSIGVLLCASADAQVYLTELPDWTLPQAKMDEFYALGKGE